jgi:hypothetical protein
MNLNFNGNLFVNSWMTQIMNRINIKISAMAIHDGKSSNAERRAAKGKSSAIMK